MKISDLLRLSLDNLKRRKGRTILTVLGVIIGTCSIVMMVSIGVALDKSYDDMMQGMGDLTKIEVYNWGSESNQKVEPLTKEVIDNFTSIDGVELSTPLYRPRYFSRRVASGNNDKYIGYGDIMGISKNAIEAYGYELLKGRFPTEKDKEYTVLVGENFAYNFENTKKQFPNNRVDPYPDENGNIKDPFVDPLKDDIKLQANEWQENGQKTIIEEELKIVGVIKQDESKGYETYSGIIMDIDDVMKLEKEYMKKTNVKDTSSNKGRNFVFDQAIVKVNDLEKVDSVIEELEGLGYNTWSPTSMRNEMKKQAKIIQLVLGGLGSIAMLVSAISIANTMTMAIYERTKEIGIMKVLGCEIKDIKNMFLAESAGIGFLGGLIGIIICYMMSAGLNMIGAALNEGMEVTISVIPVWLAIFGMGFSTIVGIISGYVPAMKAVKVTALSAIRHD